MQEMPLDGSSPRARGTSPQVRPGRLVRRFIPARAGNVNFQAVMGTKALVHPRARGERFSGSHRARDFAGSSPRARGTFNRWGLA